MRAQIRIWIVVYALTVAPAGGAEPGGPKGGEDFVPTVVFNEPVEPSPVVPAFPVNQIDLSQIEPDGDRLVQRLEDGRSVVYTMDGELQQFADAYFDRYKVPAAAAVILNSRTGRVLALSQKRHKKRASKTDQVAFDPTPPAASLFKIITTSALLEHGQIPLNTSTCYAGGARKLTTAHLDAVPKNHSCATLTSALGKSINAIFAKLSDRHLNRNVMSQYAELFGFNRELPFDMFLPASSAEIPADRLERARTAAGFWHSFLTPVHAAMIAQSIAQDGAMLRPYLVDHLEDAAGETLWRAQPGFIGRTVSKETAQSLREALRYTVSRGTARKAFHRRNGPVLPGIDVAGKTGTLTRTRPHRAYSWFVGMAPAQRPEVAIAVLVVNEPKWWIKSTDAAAELLRKYFDLKHARKQR